MKTTVQTRNRPACCLASAWHQLYTKYLLCDLCVYIYIYMCKTYEHIPNSVYTHMCACCCQKAHLAYLRNRCLQFQSHPCHQSRRAGSPKQSCLCPAGCTSGQANAVNLHQLNGMVWYPIPAKWMMDRLQVFRNKKWWDTPRVWPLPPHVERRNAKSLPTSVMILFTNCMSQRAYFKDYCVEFFVHVFFGELDSWFDMLRGFPKEKLFMTDLFVFTGHFMAGRIPEDLGCHLSPFWDSCQSVRRWRKQSIIKNMPTKKIINVCWV